MLSKLGSHWTKTEVTDELKYFDMMENNVEKENNAGCQHFFLFPKCFTYLVLLRVIKTRVFFLVQSKHCFSSCKTIYKHYFGHYNAFKKCIKHNFYFDIDRASISTPDNIEGTPIKTNTLKQHVLVHDLRLFSKFQHLQYLLLYVDGLM